MSFKNKVVLVTGASSGIGAAIAILFTHEGANVSIVGRNETKLKDSAAKCLKAGKKPLIIKADVAIDEECQRIIKETVDKFGQIDVLVNNAGFSKFGGILEGKVLESYDAIMSVNVRAVVNLTALAAPHLVKTKGTIVNISSVAALSQPTTPEFISYFVSKAALDQFTKASAKELATKGVRVNSVNPGPVETDFFDNAGSGSSMDMDWKSLAEMTALKRVSKAEEIAEIVMYLTGNKAEGITGSIFVIDNGYLLR